MFLSTASLFFHWFFKILFGLKVHGQERVPRTGAAILAMNHCSNWDPLVLGGGLGNIRPWRGIGKKELFEVPVVGAFLRACGGIPVDRSRGDSGALKTSLKILRNGELFIVFPEGTRGKGARKRSPKPGIGFLSERTDAPVIPVRITGTGDGLLPKVGKLSVIVGRPISFSQFAQGEAGKGRERHQAFANHVMKTIYSLGVDN